ncbi:hypothetical protein BS50DRAFT_567354 [Corynespora cassiicola Philippines]|uniref:Uncharacterized protein n=1 Tax=Corynespora cassiicola Philippines TaxID=1448308 RepID=A0A2T2PA58_CORCC|nr:hypothetical protein BS50DRAFT_567354 [Corynespora cassiicola Philippines]
MPRQCARFSPPCHPAAVIQNPIVYPAVAAATTYTVANAVPVTPVAANPVVVSPQPAQPAVVRIRDDIQLENRRLATQRGAYDPKRIKPADARPDDAFWCREKNGEYHLRTYYQIENECYPGRWLMDAKRGYLVFYRH